MDREWRFLGKKKRIIWIILLVLLIAAVCILFESCGKNQKIMTNDQKDVSRNLLKDKDPIEKIYSVPKGYGGKSSRPGKIKKITYPVKMIGGGTVMKSALVYLPYGYRQKDTHTRYNVFYLMHGYGGTINTYFGTKDKPRKFKNILDHMIQNGDIDPLIVVTPTFTLEYNDYYTELNGAASEISGELMKEVETSFHTYAKEGVDADFRSSRSHRGIGGFSMGASVTWRILRDYAVYFQYYLPMSMPIYYSPSGYDPGENTEETEKIIEGLRNSGVRNKAYFVYGASGTEDFMCEGTMMQVKTLADYSEWFTYTEKNFHKGNIMFHAWEGRDHHYYRTYPYLYNGLIRFFKKES